MGLYSCQVNGAGGPPRPGTTGVAILSNIQSINGSKARILDVSTGSVVLF